MSKLTDPNRIKEILNRHGFRFSKSLGQNFLIDDNIPSEIVRLSGIDKNWGVIEVGPGIGCLTRELSAASKKVISIELDTRLLPVLKETLADCGNVKVLNDDILKVDINALIDREFGRDMPVSVCANLPYYITTPVIMKLLEECRGISSVTVMVQREVAQRLCAKPGTHDAGAISLSVSYYASAQMVLNVPPHCFMPSPKVSSSVIRLDILDEPPVCPQDKEFFFKVIRAAFSQRRKTLLNALSATLSHLKREEISRAISELSLPADVRGERLSLEDFSRLSDLLIRK